MSHYSELTSGSSRRGARAEGSRRDEGTNAPDSGYDTEATGSSYEEAEWESVAVFGAGLAAGLVLGAALALILAPRSGEETRELLGERSRWLTDRFADRFGDVRGNVERATRRTRRKLRRGITRGRWMVEDLRG